MATNTNLDMFEKVAGNVSSFTSVFGALLLAVLIFWGVSSAKAHFKLLSNSSMGFDELLPSLFRILMFILVVVTFIQYI